MGPLQPETIGLMDMGVLCIFFKKYILCVLVSLSSLRNSSVMLSICPRSFILWVRWLIDLVREGV